MLFPLTFIIISPTCNPPSTEGLITFPLVLSTSESATTRTPLVLNFTPTGVPPG